jgi:hypothetical protein
MNEPVGLGLSWTRGFTSKDAFDVRIDRSRCPVTWNSSRYGS